MITVKGYRYYEDMNMPVFIKKFENLGQMMCHIQYAVYDKNSIQLPAMNHDGSFDQDFAETMSGCLRFYNQNHYELICIELIIDDYEKVLFSSGSRTGGRGHISSEMSEILQGFLEWKNRGYDFAE